MNLEANPTPEQLQSLLREADDDAGHHVLWVKCNGDVVLSTLPRDRPLNGFDLDYPDLQLRCETFLAGNEYVGPKAAADQEWVADLLERLLQEWPKSRGKPAVAYVGRF